MNTDPISDLASKLTICLPAFDNKRYYGEEDC